MSTIKISQLPASTAPLDGDEVGPFVQDGNTVKVPAADLRGQVSLRDFGAKGDGRNDDTANIKAAFDWAKSVGGAKILAPRGTYRVTATIDISGCNNTMLVGDGQDNTIFQVEFASGSVFSSTTQSWYRTFSDFSITSTVTRTADGYFYSSDERRSLFSRLKFTGHIHGFVLEGFELCTIRDCVVTTPSGAGSAIWLGTTVAQSGSGIWLDSLFLRGNNDVTQDAPTGYYGLYANDVDAIFAVNCDIGGVLRSDAYFNTTNRSANHYFTQCWFDATKLSHCVEFAGTVGGALLSSTFNSCWFASAGKLTGGNVEACGLKINDEISYSGVQFVGCRFFNNAGTGVLIEPRGAQFTFSGCVFDTNGADAATNRYGLWFVPGAAATVGPVITGCYFTSNAPADIRLDQHANLVTLTGCNINTGVSKHPSSGFNNGCAGNLDESLAAVASANQIAVPMTQNNVVITGTTDIAGIYPTYVGHVIMLDFEDALTVIDASINLRLAGNYSTAAGKTLTLMCNSLGNWVEISRATT